MQAQKLKQILTRPIFAFKINYSKTNPKNYNWEKIKRILKMVIIITTAVFMILLTVDLIKSDFISTDEEDMEFATNIADMVTQHLDENYFGLEYENSNVGCNVSGIMLHGDLVTYIAPGSTDEEGVSTADQTASEDIVYYIEEAEKDNNIKAIVLKIDSYGGGLVADDEVATALKRATKPTVAMIRGAGLSAAYYAATGADVIFAAKESDVGGIGVTFSYLDYTGQHQKEGITFNQISSGKFKDLMNPDKPLTYEERQLLERDLKIIHENFIQTVAENRNLPVEKVRALADGSSMLGAMALENKLIDRIGGIYEVEEYLTEKIGEQTKICW